VSPGTTSTVLPETSPSASSATITAWPGPQLRLLDYDRHPGRQHRLHLFCPVAHHHQGLIG